MYGGLLNHCASCGEWSTKSAKLNDSNKGPYLTSCELHRNPHSMLNTAPAAGLSSD